MLYQIKFAQFSSSIAAHWRIVAQCAAVITHREVVVVLRGSQLQIILKNETAPKWYVLAILNYNF